MCICLSMCVYLSVCRLKFDVFLLGLMGVCLKLAAI